MGSVVELFRADDVAYRGGVDTEDSDLTDDGDVPGFGFAASTERTLACWSAHLLDSPKFDPSLYLVAEAGDAVVGAALTQDVGDYGYVRQLAVSPAQRGPGLGLLSGTSPRTGLLGLPVMLLLIMRLAANLEPLAGR